MQCVQGLECSYILGVHHRKGPTFISYFHQPRSSSRWTRPQWAAIHLLFRQPSRTPSLHRSSRRGRGLVARSAASLPRCTASPTAARWTWRGRKGTEIVARSMAEWGRRGSSVWSGSRAGIRHSKLSLRNSWYHACHFTNTSTCTPSCYPCSNVISLLPCRVSGGKLGRGGIKSSNGSHQVMWCYIAGCCVWCYIARCCVWWWCVYGKRVVSVCDVCGGVYAMCVMLCV